MSNVSVVREACSCVCVRAYLRRRGEEIWISDPKRCGTFMRPNNASGSQTGDLSEEKESGKKNLRPRRLDEYRWLSGKRNSPRG
ncbi:hypothetical protein K0M31_011307 [Melipona bicolor]|uniref:Uncharacterized protein n=1 Tax=Melipona bicolor TaxID=60889 RepID=A0AA40G9A6_9HYME|nr:hypothetical protein K0M31_011307 [Melipona bicolor]